jgi:cyclopropane-fatty-acyl-phospholipid synthase
MTLDIAGSAGALARKRRARRTVMHEPVAPNSRRQPPELLLRLIRPLIRPWLNRIGSGSLTLVLPTGMTLHHRADKAGPDAVLILRRWRALWRLAAAGDLGLARAYIDGDCRTPDLKSLIDFGARNSSGRSDAPSGLPLARLIDRVRHGLRANTRRGSRRNIAAHYDLGNTFYSHWLDRGMNYSSALYEPDVETLEQAQHAKLARIAQLLEVAPGNRVLEIGCGWGPLMERLAVDHGCAVTGVTLSARQLEFAHNRLSRAAPGRCEIRLQDYRDIKGRFDRIVSIEMLEAVGEKYWPIYFRQLRQLLADDGCAVIQIITIDEARFARYRRRPDFIQRFIFPGGMLPTKSVLSRQSARAGLRIVTRQDFGPSYARTLAEWRRRFLAGWPDIAPLGFDLRFKRMWDYYLTYCQVGFEIGAIDVSLVKLVPEP